MADLTILDATYGRDTVGKKKLVADLAGDLKRIRTELTGKELTTLMDEISKYWQGKDANEFKAKIKSTVGEIDAKIKKLSSDLEKSFDTDAKSFSKMQNVNANVISGLK